MNVTARITQRRTAGKTTCAIVRQQLPDTVNALADAAVQAHGFRALGDAWLIISAHDAQVIATSVLHRDLASGDVVMRLAEAAELATAFLDLAPEPLTYLTNGEWAGALESDGTLETSIAWDPIANATFDAGVVCVGDGETAILWVEDA